MTPENEQKCWQAWCEYVKDKTESGVIRTQPLDRAAFEAGFMAGVETNDLAGMHHL